MKNEILVGNLAMDATEEDIRSFFSGTTGVICSVSIPLNQKTGKNHGYAYVEMCTYTEAQQAVVDLDGTSIADRVITMTVVGEPPAKRKWYHFGS